MTLAPSSDPPRATAFIVTVYGDVADPRGGSLWMGTLIDICAAVGLSETVVRTAVSRLVAAGQLQGERQGRRSFYRLTPRARVDFRAASRVIFAGPGEARATAWRLTIQPRPEGQPPLAASGFAEIAAGVWLGPDRGAPAPGAAGLRPSVDGDAAAIRDFAARHWDLDRLSADYRAVILRHGPLRERLPLAGAEALRARLRLIHDFRLVLLRDPRLPAPALPADWPGDEARDLFADLYGRLSVTADDYIGRTFHGSDGHLPAQTPETVARLASLGGGRQ